MNIEQLLNSEVGDQIISSISGKVGTSNIQTKSVINQAAPALLGMLKNNAGSEQGASGILNALSKHDGSIFDNLSGFFNSDDSKDGDGILGHILGAKRSGLEGAISQKTGVSSSQVSSIISMLAPIIMGYIGKESKGNTSGGIGDLLGGLLSGTKSGGQSDLLTSLLDQDGDGQLGVNDVITAISGSGKSKKSGGLGGLLGGLFGKK